MSHARVGLEFFIQNFLSHAPFLKIKSKLIEVTLGVELHTVYHKFEYHLQF